MGLSDFIGRRCGDSAAPTAQPFWPRPLRASQSPDRMIPFRKAGGDGSRTKLFRSLWAKMRSGCFSPRFTAAGVRRPTGWAENSKHTKPVVGDRRAGPKIHVHERWATCITDFCRHRDNRVTISCRKRTWWLPVHRLRWLWRGGAARRQARGAGQQLPEFFQNDICS